MLFFFCKQKTAYEMRISDWSSDVCSSDLTGHKCAYSNAGSFLRAKSRFRESWRVSERIWTAGLVVIGDEILSGGTQDANIANSAKWLNVQGVRLDRKSTRLNSSH